MKSTKKVPSRLALQNLNPLFHKRDKSEDREAVPPAVLKQAKLTGTLNLSGRGLASVPDDVFNINGPDKGSETTLEGLSVSDDEAWWNRVQLSSLDLSSNKLSTLSPKISNLSCLTTLLLYDNGLTSIPKEIAKLEKLTRINLSRNKLKDLPGEFYTLPELRYLNLSYNCLEELHPSMSDLHMLEVLDASNNNIVTVPCGIGFLVRVTELYLAHNCIKDLPADIVNMRCLQKLDLMHNEITQLPKDIGCLRKLQCLYLQHNNIMDLPTFEGCQEMQELHISDNFIQRIPRRLCVFLTHLKIFDIRDNKLTKLPEEISFLKALVRLDISNNSIAQLPPTLGSLPHLVSLQLEGNPIKTIRRDIIQCGTARILKTLRDRTLIVDYPSSPRVRTQTESSDEAIFVMPGDGLNSPRNPPPSVVLGGDSIYPNNDFQFTQRPIRWSHASTYPNFQNFGNNFNQTYPFTQTSQSLQPYSLAQNNTHIQTYPLAQNTESIQPYPLSDATPSIQPYPMSEATQPPIQPYSMSEGTPENFENVQSQNWQPIMRQTHCLNVTTHNLADVPDDIFELAASEYVNCVDLSKNQLQTLPKGILALSNCATELVFANNAIADIPTFVSQFKHIALINISCNMLKDLPKEFGLLNTLRELNISNNRFEKIPSCVYDLSALEILLARDNRIAAIDATPEGLGALKRLATLDLGNNNIEQVPPILGKLENITTLELIGNPFRQPRHQILQKGTDTIMSYLRDRIPH